MKLGFASDLQDMSRLTEVEVGTIADDVNTEERLEVVCLGDLVAVGSEKGAELGDECGSGGCDGEVIYVDAEEDLVAIWMLFVKETRIMGGARVVMREEEVGELIIEGFRGTRKAV